MEEDTPLRGVMETLSSFEDSEGLDNLCRRTLSSSSSISKTVVPSSFFVVLFVLFCGSRGGSALLLSILFGRRHGKKPMSMCCAVVWLNKCTDRDTVFPGVQEQRMLDLYKMKDGICLEFLSKFWLAGILHGDLLSANIPK
jgi:hypothetical protein